jgi:hypothetical protein
VISSGIHPGWMPPKPVEHPHERLVRRLGFAAAKPYEAFRAAHVQDFTGLFDFALHPGRQVSPITPPELAEAARVPLTAR